MNRLHFSNAIQFAIAGAVLALVLISILVFTVPNPNLAWGNFWFIKPLVITPFITSIGGVCFYFINTKKTNSKFLNLLLFLSSALILLFFIWIGTVLGLDGTLWN